MANPGSENHKLPCGLPQNMMAFICDVQIIMTGCWFLKELAKELDEIPRHLTSDNFNLCVQKLSKVPQIIVIDEIDYLVNDTKTIETLRDIHDKTNCPIIFVGMGLVHKKLECYKHLYDGFSEIIKFETFEVADVKQIANELSEISFTVDAIEILYKKHNRFRQIVQTINQFETIAKENNLTEITQEIAEAIL